MSGQLRLIRSDDTHSPVRAWTSNYKHQEKWNAELDDGWENKIVEEIDRFVGKNPNAGGVVFSLPSSSSDELLRPFDVIGNIAVTQTKEQKVHLKNGSLCRLSPKQSIKVLSTNIQGFFEKYELSGSESSSLDAIVEARMSTPIPIACKIQKVIDDLKGKRFDIRRLRETVSIAIAGHLDIGEDISPGITPLLRGTLIPFTTGPSNMQTLFIHYDCPEMMSAGPISLIVVDKSSELYFKSLVKETFPGSCIEEIQSSQIYPFDLGILAEKGIKFQILDLKPGTIAATWGIRGGFTTGDCLIGTLNFGLMQWSNKNGECPYDNRLRFSYQFNCECGFPDPTRATQLLHSYKWPYPLDEARVRRAADVLKSIEATMFKIQGNCRDQLIKNLPEQELFEILVALSKVIGKDGSDFANVVTWLKVRMYMGAVIQRVNPFDTKYTFTETTSESINWATKMSQSYNKEGELKMFIEGFEILLNGTGMLEVEYMESRAARGLSFPSDILYGKTKRADQGNYPDVGSSTGSVTSSLAYSEQVGGSGLEFEGKGKSSDGDQSGTNEEEMESSKEDEDTNKADPNESLGGIDFDEFHDRTLNKSAPQTSNKLLDLMKDEKNFRDLYLGMSPSAQIKMKQIVLQKADFVASMIESTVSMNRADHRPSTSTQFLQNFKVFPDASQFGKPSSTFQSTIKPSGGNSGFDQSKECQDESMKSIEEKSGDIGQESSDDKPWKFEHSGINSEEEKMVERVFHYLESKLTDNDLPKFDRYTLSELISIGISGKTMLLLKNPGQFIRLIECLVKAVAGSKDTLKELLNDIQKPKLNKSSPWHTILSPEFKDEEELRSVAFIARQALRIDTIKGHPNTGYHLHRLNFVLRRVVEGCWKNGEFPSESPFYNRNDGPCMLTANKSKDTKESELPEGFAESTLTRRMRQKPVVASSYNKTAKVLDYNRQQMLALPPSLENGVFKHLGDSSYEKIKEFLIASPYYIYKLTDDFSKGSGIEQGRKLFRDNVYKVAKESFEEAMAKKASKPQPNQVQDVDEDEDLV